MDGREYRIVISGAGIAGLTAAIALHRMGHDVHVFERHPELQPVGAGLILWSNAVNALRAIGLEHSILSIGHRLSELEILDREGATLSHMDAATIGLKVGSPTLAVHRAELMSLLRQQLPEDAISTGNRLTDFEQSDGSITARFNNDSEVKCDVLVGADGIWSTVRAQIHGNQPARYSGYTAWRAVTANPIAESTTRSTESWGNGLRFGWVPISNNRVYWFAVKNAHEGEAPSASGHRVELLSLFGDWHDPIRETILSTHEDEIVRHDIYDRPPIAHWGVAQVTLAGDAAHPTTPNTGQGAAQAIEDAVVLTDCLNRYRTIDGALRAYESVRYPRTKMITDVSRQMGRLAQLDNEYAARARNWLAGLVPDGVSARQISAIVDWTPPDLVFNRRSEAPSQ